MRSVVYILLSLCWVPTFAQNDSVKSSHNYPLPIFTVTSSKNSSGALPFNEKIHLDENIKSGTPLLSNMLATKSDVFINLNSGAALATASIRGNTSEQVPVLWCGVNLQNPANGTIDLSLLPGFLFSSADIIYGNTATLNGSGFMGGSIQLNNNALFADTTILNLLSGFASFHNTQSGIKLLLANKNLFSRSTVYYTSGLNNYPFYNRAVFNMPLQNMSNAAFTEFHVMQEMSLRIKSSQIIDIKYWYANSHRQISPTMLTADDSSYQNDVSHRVMLAWQYCSSKAVWYVRQHLLYETLNYYNGLAKIVYPSQSLLSSSEIENHYFPSTSWHITSGLQYISAHAITDGFSKWNYRNETALYASIKKTVSKYLSISSSARKEFTLNKLIPFIYNAEATYALNSNFYTSLQWSKHYRLPTLNELYWQPGGNIDLKPENGNLVELTTQYNKNFKKTGFDFSIALFSNSLLNQIVWLPISVEVWSPVNYSHVWSRGANFTSSFNYKFNKFVLQLNSNISYTRANQVNIPLTSYKVDNQLIYTPRYKTFNKLKLIHNTLAIYISGTYTSQVFTDENRTYYLPGYFIADAGIEKIFKISNLFDVCVTLSSHNTTDTHYEVLIYRPQPMRYYSLTLFLTFKK